ncbi:MAG: S8 family serine peptidase [Anaerolineales bacterium]
MWHQLRNLTSALSIAGLMLSGLSPSGVLAATANQPPALTDRPQGVSLSNQVKALVDAADSEAIQRLAAVGAGRLVDYGAFALYLVPEAEVAQLNAVLSLTLAPEFDEIALRGGALNTRTGSGPQVPEALRQTRSDGAQFWMVQFIGPVKDEWIAGLTERGLQIVTYMAYNAYVVWGDGSALAKLDEWQQVNVLVQWTGPYHPAYRVAPSVWQRVEAATPASPAAPDEMLELSVQFFNTESIDDSVARLLALGGAVLKQPGRVLNYTNVSLRVPAAAVAEIARWPDVFNIGAHITPEKLDEAQNQIIAGNITMAGSTVTPGAPGYLAWLAAKGFPTNPGNYPLVDIVDDGLDVGDAANVLHPDFYELGLNTNADRVLYAGNCTPDALGNAVGGHGNLNTGIVGAYNNLSGAPHVDGNGYRRGLGVSPYNLLASTKIFLNSGSYDVSNCGGNDAGVVLASYNGGAAITSNSWGAPVGGLYDDSSQAYDALTRDAAPGVLGNQQILHVFAAGNSGRSGVNTIGSPGTAKNVLTVGATESVRDEGVLDGCNLGAGDNADDMAEFSSRGPTDDSRVKPDLVAPGTHVQGQASQDPGFNGTGVCGADGNGNASEPEDYYPAGQTLYTWSSGTSHSTPAAAGAAALTWEYYGRVLAPGQTPSPAMIKALMLNSARPINGLGSGNTLPNNDEGWGDVNLGTLTDGTPRRLIDQTQTITATGQTITITGSIANPARPVRVTLAWTDAPGPLSGNAFVNNLNLEVTVNGTLYRGNVFSGTVSATGGSFDTRNNVESVYLPAGLSAAYTVRVIAGNIAGDGLPGNADITDQDFALVIYNSTFGDSTLAGAVTAAGTPLNAATVQAVTGPITGTLTFAANTSATGAYSMTLPVDTFTVSAWRYGYSLQSASATTVSGTTTIRNFALTAQPTFTLSGNITDAVTGQPLTATVKVIDPFGTVRAQRTGASYNFNLPGTGGTFSYTVSAEAPLYLPENAAVNLTAATTRNFALTAATTGFAGFVRSLNTTAPVTGAVVSLTGPISATGATDGTGYFQITGLLTGTYTATVSAPLYATEVVSNVTLISNTITTRNFTLASATLGLTPAALQRTLTFGQTLTDTPGLTLTNTGSATLGYTVTETPGTVAPPPLVLTRPVLVVSRASPTAAMAVTQTLTALGHAYVLSDSVNFEGTNAISLTNSFEAVLYLGNTGTTATSASNTTLMNYLDAGGRLFIADNDLGFFNRSFAFYTTYLDAAYVSDDPGAANRALTGEDIFGGLSAASVDPFPDVFTGGAASTRVFRYVNGTTGAARITRNGYRAIYLATDFQNLGTVATNEAVERDVVRASLYWLVSGSAADYIPWLTENPLAGNVPISATQGITITWAATPANSITQPGTYTGTLQVLNTDPLAQPYRSVPVTMTVLPTAEQGRVAGIVNSGGVCDAVAAPLAGAAVLLTSSSGITTALTTDGAGAYGYWLSTTGNPYTLTVSAAGHVAAEQGRVTVTAGGTQTVDFTLRLQQPCVSVSPTALSATVAFSGTLTETLTVSNTGAAPLDFTLFESDSTGTGGPPLGPVTRPNPLGYAFAAVPYSFVDISSTGTVITLTDDAEANITLPFTFLLFGGSSTNLRVGNNGGLLVNTTAGDVPITNAAMSGAPDNFIAPFWDDFDDETGAVYWRVLGAVPNRFAVVQWHNRSHFPGPSDGATLQAILYENGNLLFQYRDVNFNNPVNDNGASATVGIRGIGAVNALQYSFNTPSVTAGLALCFVRPGNEWCGARAVPWLTESITTTVGLTGSLPIGIGFDATEVATPGTYTATLALLHNAPQPPVIVPVTMTVGAPVDFGTLNGAVLGQPICDGDSAPLAGASVIVAGGLPITLTTNASGLYSAQVFGGPSPGMPYTLTVSAPGYLTSAPIVVTVTQQLTTTTNFTLTQNAPCIEIVPLSLSSAQNTNTLVTTTLTISNTGNAPLTATVSNLPVWLTVTPISATVPPANSAVLSATFNSAGQLPGVYTATATITSNDPISPTRSLPLSLTVLGYDLVAASPNAAKSGIAGSTVTYTVNVTNTGTLSDTYNIALSGNAFTTTTPATVGPLNPNATAVVPLTVTIPLTASVGATDTVRVAIISQGNGISSASVLLTTTVRAPLFGVTVSPTTSLGVGVLGATVTHTLTVTNVGEVTDTFTVTVAGNTFTTAAPISAGPLSPNASAQLFITVTVPLTVTGPLTDTATVALTSRTDPTKTASATLRTSVILIPPTGSSKVYLPIIMR